MVPNAVRQARKIIFNLGPLVLGDLQKYSRGDRS